MPIYDLGLFLFEYIEIYLGLHKYLFLKREYIPNEFFPLLIYIGKGLSKFNEVISISVFD
jgi:hypothetical protein